MIKFQIEMLAVGAADAIIIQYFPGDGSEVVILIDAGKTEEHGKKIQKHIKEYTKTKKIDLAINTHPDSDHIGGFFYVVKNIPIEEFWIYDPSSHEFNVQSLLESVNNFNENSRNYMILQESLRQSSELIQMIDDYSSIKRREPFDGLKYSKAPIKVIGPSKNVFVNLLKKYRDIERWLKSRESTRGITESRDQLKSWNDQSKENNSSTILYFTPNNKKYLFTADSKSKYLTEAHEKYDLSNLDWLQVPHHGSKYNIDSEIISKLKPKICYISCDGSEDYPNELVVNQLKEIDAVVYSTAKNNLLHLRSTTRRNGYVKATPL